MRTARGPIEDRRGLAIRVSDGETAGVGEATPLPGWTESFEECRTALSEIDHIDADTALDADALSDRPAARHGLALALADYRARRADVPLYRRFGVEERVERVPANATVDDGPTDESVEAARAAVAAGFETVKVKAGSRPVDADVERMRAVREAVGDGIALRVDANAAWDPEAAQRAFDAFADLGVEYVEGPLAPGDLDGHRELAGGPVGVALDESLAGGVGEEWFDAADVLICKPMALGGPNRVVDLADRARRCGIDVVVTTTVDAVVARAGAVHLAAGLGIDRACGLATADALADDLADDPAPVVDGAARVPQDAGLGTDGPWEGGGD